MILVKPWKADVLLDYWSSDWGERKSQSYGKLCSQQQESLKYYKDEIKNNKRFNNLMQKLSGKVDLFAPFKFEHKNAFSK